MNHRHLRRIAGSAAAVALAASLLAAAPAGAARSREISLAGCHEHSAFFPIPRNQARGYVPAGFEPVAAPAYNENLTNLFVTSYVCGDPAAPELEMVTTHLVVEPPQEFATKSNHYVIDVGIEGPAARGFRKTLCLGGVADEAAISVTQERAVSPLGAEAGAARTSVSSDFMSTEFVVSAERTDGWVSDHTRWFFGDGSRFFDSAMDLEAWGIGSSVVTFTQQYLDVPQAAAGGSKQAVADEMTFSTPYACRR